MQNVFDAIQSKDIIYNLLQRWEENRIRTERPELERRFLKEPNKN